MGVARIALIGAILIGGGCGDSKPDEGSGRDAAVVEALIRTLVDDQPAEPDVKPVVYVVGADGAPIPIDVQAAVAAALVDDMDVRFADDRAEAVDQDTEGEPVRDGGTLVTIGAVPPEGDEVSVEITRYSDLDDNEEYLFTLRWREPDWTVTSSVVAPAVTAPDA